MSAEVRILRDPLVESVHEVAVAVVDRSGQVLYATGPVDRKAFWRSSAKPVQAMALVRLGGMERFGFSETDLALICASHSGTPEHVERVARMLTELGLSPDDLLCGAHPPLHEPSAREIWARGEMPTPLHSNCSGKHTGMLALAKLLGAPIEDYVRPSHPVQQTILSEVGAFTGLHASEIVRGVDGCSAPVFGLPITAMAEAYAHLASPESLEPSRAPAARQIVRAMTHHPDMVGGPGRFDTELMTILNRRVLSKSGAEGVVCLAVPERGLGIALKVLDGAGRAGPPAALAVLKSLDLLTEEEGSQLSAQARPGIINVAGRCVGHVEATLSWEVSAA